ncbi:HEPN domain-containing protein [Nostoc sp. CALU 1950]|uniref:ApeA N-terminal domain 1-containing protein n=1 Tax=Nostoc sp. CALU 1950 TaxID=3104321 RepID=UPI003EC08892
MEDFERVGEWWLPEMPDRKVAGILKFNPTIGGTLELLGSLINVQDGDQPSHPQLILGNCLGGRVSLLNNSKIRSQLTLEGVGITIFQTRLICDGLHIANKVDLQFLSLSIHYSYLNQWLSVSNFDIKKSYEQGELNINCKNNISVIQTSLGEDIKLSFDVISFHEETWVQDLEINQIAYATISFSEKRPLKEIEKIMLNFQNFLSFAIMHPVYPLIVTGIMVAEIFDSLDGSYKQGAVSVKLYRPILDGFREYQSALFPAKSPLFHADILFGFRKISNNFNTLIQNWFKKTDWLETVYNLYFSTFYNSNLYLNNIFLILVQALEVYHRKNPEFEQLETSEDKHTQRIELILNDTPIEHREWLKSKLKYSNEKRLAARLQAIFEYLSDIILQLATARDGFKRFSNKREQKHFIRQVVDNRNYLTHYDESLKNRIGDESKLYYITEKLKIIICLCLMKELGFNKEEVAQFILDGNVGLLMEWSLTEHRSVAIEE